MKELIFTLILAVVACLLLVVLIYINHLEKYKKSAYAKLVRLSEEYFQKITLKDNLYLEKIDLHGSNIDISLKSKGDEDPLTKLKVKKGYRFFKEKVIYFFNDNIKEKVNIVKIDEKDYFEINDKIKSINILATFESKNNLLVRYNVKKNSQGYSLEIDNSEVEVNEKE